MDPIIAKLGLKKLGKNIFGTFLRQGIGIIIGLGLSILLARVLGPAGNGQYAIGILLPTMLATFLNLGVSPANVYFIASNRIKPYSAFKTNLRLWFILSGIGVIISICIIETQSNKWFPGIPPSFLWLGLLAFPLSLLQIFLKSFLQGLQDFKNYNYALLVTPVVTLLLAAFLVGLLNMGVFGALLSFIIGQASGLVITLIILQPYLRANDEKNGDHIDNYTKECLGYGWKAHLSNILAFVNYRADLFLVNFFLAPTATGVYVIAVQIVEKLWILSQSVSTVILPRLSELHTEEEKRQHLTPLIARWVLLVSSIGALILALLVSPFINFFYGSEYVPAVGALFWLIPGVLVGSVSKVLANDIAARGRPELNLYVSMLVVSVNIICNIILIPRLGIVGAAIATTIAYVLNSITKLWLYSYLSKNPWWKAILFSSSDKLLFQEGINTLKNSIFK
ncbi:flippase [Methanosarcina sp. Mfa9]|uniref:flippase n=1 Tax=Methanosarcina sp. Mfa9 TaxID=3439063 RepID=UPI003F8588AE